MTLAGSPFEVAYPVKFYSEGDATKEAFGKHIQEIERIYGLLNALNADKLSTNVFNNIHNAHVNSNNQHPNLYLTTLKGDLPVNRVSGDWPTSRLSGNLDGSRITGDLNGATIDKGKVTGLADFVKSTSSIDTGTTSRKYIKINNLILQWGSGTMETNNRWKRVNFPISFSTANYSIAEVPQVYRPEAEGTATCPNFGIRHQNSSYFDFRISMNEVLEISFDWFAIGF